VNLAAGEKRRISFLLKDPSTGLDVVKTLALDGDSYIAELELTIKRGGQAVPQAKLRIGPSIGDQGVKHYSFYSVAPKLWLRSATRCTVIQRRHQREQEDS